MTTYSDYEWALDSLVHLADRVEAQRVEIAARGTERIAAVDADGRRVRSEFDALDVRRNKVEREVAALARDLAATPDAAAPPIALGSARDIDAALADMSRRAAKARQNWEWVQRYRSRARQQSAPAPVRAVPVVPPHPPQPEPEPSSLSRWIVIALIVLVLVVVVGVILLMM